MGRIKSFYNGIENEKILCLEKTRKGYFRCTLCKDKKTKRYFVHRLVILTFKEESNLEVNHIDGNKINNKLDNLEYCTRSENQKHAYKIGLANINYCTIKIKQYNKQNIFIKEYESAHEVERQIGISQQNINACINNKRKSAGGFIWRKA